jgi:hypothetical protein
MTAVPPPSEPEERPAQVRVRRSAKILNFLLTGAFLGAVAALIATFAFPSEGEYPAGQVFGFLLLIGVAVGAALGGLVAVLVERALRRRSRQVDAVHEITLAPDEPEFGSDGSQYGDLPDGAQSDTVRDGPRSASVGDSAQYGDLPDGGAQSDLLPDGAQSDSLRPRQPAKDADGDVNRPKSGRTPTA